MPRARKECGIQGCRVLVPGGTHCPQHQHRFKSGGPSRTSDPRHRVWRAAVLDRAHWWCEIRYPDICTGRAKQADHIVAVAFGGAEFDPLNGQAACDPCHKRKSSGEGAAMRWGNTLK